MEKNETIIEVNNIEKYFKTRKGLFKAVDDISFSINKGKVYGLVGENGSGKTTTIKMLMGLIKPTFGNVKFNIAGGLTKIYSKIGYVPEKPALYGDMLPLDYLIYMGGLSGMDKDKAINYAQEFLKNFDLDNAIEKKIETFSSGMKQKLLIIQALMHDPEILILDEPTTALDPIGQKQLLNVIKFLSEKKGVTIIISSHHMEELEMIVDYVLIFDAGKIIINSDIESLKKGSSEQLEIKTTNLENVANILRKKFNLQSTTIIDDKIVLSAKGIDKLRKSILETIISSGEELISVHTSRKSLWSVVMEKLKK